MFLTPIVSLLRGKISPQPGQSLGKSMNTPLADQGSVQISAIIPSFCFCTVELYHRANVEFSPKLNSLFAIYLGSALDRGNAPWLTVRLRAAMMSVAVQGLLLLLPF